jgi:hypothetical protein
MVAQKPYGSQVSDKVYEKVSGLPIAWLLGMPALFSVTVPWLFGATAALGWDGLPLHVLFLTFIVVYIALPVFFAASLGFRMTVGARLLFSATLLMTVFALVRIRFDVADKLGWALLLGIAIVLAVSVMASQSPHLRRSLSPMPRPRGLPFAGVALLGFSTILVFIGGVGVQSATYPEIFTDLRLTSEATGKSVQQISRAAADARFQRAAILAGLPGQVRLRDQSAADRLIAHGDEMSALVANSNVSLANVREASNRFNGALINFVDSDTAASQLLKASTASAPDSLTPLEVRRLDVLELRATQVYAELYGKTRKEMAEAFRDARMAGAALYLGAALIVAVAWALARRGRQRQGEPAYAFAFSVLIIFALPMLTPINEDRINVENPLAPFIMANWFVPDLVVHDVHDADADGAAGAAGPDGKPGETPPGDQLPPFDNGVADVLRSMDGRLSTMETDVGTITRRLAPLTPARQQ